MPSTTRKQSTSSSTAQLPSKKRQRQSLPHSSSPANPAPPPLPRPEAPSAAPVLSAVAARRAAQLAASASASPASSPAPSNSSGQVQVESHQLGCPPARASPPPASDAQETSESSDSASDVEAALLDRKSSVDRKGKGKVTGRGKGKEPSFKHKKDTAARYFTGAAQADEISLAYPDQAQDSRMQSDEVAELPATPRAARPRRRREKTAFVDPECYSNFRLQESVNAWPTCIPQPEGVDLEGVVYGLRVGEDLVVHGTFDLSVLSGSISLLGSTISAKAIGQSISLPDSSSAPAHRVYSPASHPIAPITAFPNDPDAIKPSSLALYLDAQIDISEFAAVILVVTTQTGIEGIEGCLKSGGSGCANGMFPWPSRATGSCSSGRSWRLITEPVPGLTILRQIEPWSSALAGFVPSNHGTTDEPMADPGRLVVLVEGPKRVGKSTFSKMLLNRLLDRYEAVAYLDTDLGQPEFTTSGFVSLNVLRKPTLGPAFTHLSLPTASHFLGSTSPASDPTSYMSAISSLLASYALEVEYPLIEEPIPSGSRRRNHHQASRHQVKPASASSGGKVRERVPLVINTQGWVKGLGADLLSKLKAESQPTHVCSFASPYDNAEDAGGYSDGGSYTQQQQQQYEASVEEVLPYQLLTLPAATQNPLESKWTASDYRTLSIVSYFHSNLAASTVPLTSPSNTLPSAWDFSFPVLAHVPYALDWTRDAGQVESVHLLGGDDVSYEHVLHALNASLVAIVATNATNEPLTTANSDSATSAFPFDPNSAGPSYSSCRALGLGLVRSIKPSSTTLELVTPIPPPSGSVSLVKGSLEVPLALMLDHTATETEREQGLKGIEWKDVPFLSIEEGDGGGRRRVRRNLMRRGQA